MSYNTTFIFRSKIEPGSKFWEGLRISAAFVGMDHIPLIVFQDEAVLGLLPNALPVKQLWEYLKTTSDLAGIHVLDVDMAHLGLCITNLDPELKVQMITLDNLAEKVADNKVVAIF